MRRARKSGAKRKLSLLLEVSKELRKQQELDRLLDKVVDFTFQIMNVTVSRFCCSTASRTS